MGSLSSRTEGRDGFLSGDRRQDGFRGLAAIGGASGLAMGGAIGAGYFDGGNRVGRGAAGLDD